MVVIVSNHDTESGLSTCFVKEILIVKVKGTLVSF